tara:strand:- start:2047 stop:2694 length:648 start_codon:yes stop_codon:yes gene_type:complete
MKPDLIDKVKMALDQKEQLSDWEQGFIESLWSFYTRYNRLSERQIEIFEKIWHESLSVNALSIAKAWAGSYNEEKKRIAVICATYYKAAGYFTDLAHNVLNCPEFVPTEKQWKKMCQNKYALKVVAEYEKDPAFIVGSLVEFRSTASFNLKTHSKGMPCVVISSGGYIEKAAKGTKPYKVLPFGSASVLQCEERDLKKCKNPRKTKKVVDNDLPF